MNTKSAAPAQAQTQDVVAAPIWNPMSSAPAGDVTVCIDIWCAVEDRRITDCFWNLGRWSHEIFSDRNDNYAIVAVNDPVAWMPSPAKPDFDGEGA